METKQPESYTFSIKSIKKCHVSWLHFERIRDPKSKAMIRNSIFLIVKEKKDMVIY